MSIFLSIKTSGHSTDFLFASKKHPASKNIISLNYSSQALLLALLSMLNAKRYSKIWIPTAHFFQSAIASRVTKETVLGSGIKDFSNSMLYKCKSLCLRPCLHPPYPFIRQVTNSGHLFNQVHNCTVQLHSKLFLYGHNHLTLTLPCKVHNRTPKALWRLSSLCIIQVIKQRHII